MRPQDADDVITKRRLSVCRSPGIIQSESSTLKSGSSCRFTWILRAERDVMLFSTGSVFIRHVWMKRDREKIKEQTRGGGKWINNKRRVSHEIWEEIRRKGRKGARLMRRRANRWITFRVFVCRREINLTNILFFQKHFPLFIPRKKRSFHPKQENKIKQTYNINNNNNNQSLRG